jgi:predicted sulfurtransferase
MYSNKRYCTGGVRCERASQLLKHEFGHRVNGVYQLQGGIEKYLQEFPDGGFWQGKMICYYHILYIIYILRQKFCF